MKKLTKNKNKGFTIVELIVVMAIIAILILIAVPTFTKYIDDANKTSEIGTANTIYKSAMATVLESYVSGNHSTEAELVTSLKDGISGRAGTDDTIIPVIYYAEPNYKIGTPPASDWGVYVRCATVTNGGVETVIVDESADIFILAPVNGDGTRNVYDNGIYSKTVKADGSDLSES